MGIIRDRCASQATSGPHARLGLVLKIYLVLFVALAMTALASRPLIDSPNGCQGGDDCAPSYTSSPEVVELAEAFLADLDMNPEGVSCGKLKKVSDRGFEEKVLESSVPVLVDFSAPWCVPCKKLDKTLEELARELGDDVVIAKVNVGNNREIAERYGVRFVPTMILFDDGSEHWRANGARSSRSLRNMLSRVLDSPEPASAPSVAVMGGAE